LFDFTNGLRRCLFPLTTDEQMTHQFRLIVEEIFERHKTYHIGFAPKDTEDINWAGEASIDESEFQRPICVFTKLSRRKPFAIRPMLFTPDLLR
jgi:hypothetical protein